MKFKCITTDNFLKKQNCEVVNFEDERFFTWADVDELHRIDSSTSMKDFIHRYISYVLFSLRYPKFFSSFILPATRNLIFKQQKPDSIFDVPTVKNCIIKASIMKSFKPAIVLEIGTYLGWAAAAFKKAIPKSTIYTLNPKNNSSANNPIKDKYIGSFYRKKKLKVNQLWGDSMTYDFNLLGTIDTVYIDGNHAYDYVVNDLSKTCEIVKKAIIIDDYRQPNSKEFSPWNESVWKACNHFLSYNSHYFKEAFWLYDSQYAVLVKK
ncbi:class I SAM-dependent methyltransferase [Patescibacteria group bacterium]